MNSSERTEKGVLEGNKEIYIYLLFFYSIIKVPFAAFITCSVFITRSFYIFNIIFRVIPVIFIVSHSGETTEWVIHNENR